MHCVAWSTPSTLICLEAEQDQDLSAKGIIRRRTKIGQQALSEIEDFKPFQLAEKAVAHNIAPA